MHRSWKFQEEATLNYDRAADRNYWARGTALQIANDYKYLANSYALQAEKYFVVMRSL